MKAKFINENSEIFKPRPGKEIMQDINKNSLQTYFYNIQKLSFDFWKQRGIRFNEMMSVQELDEIVKIWDFEPVLWQVSGNFFPTYASIEMGGSSLKRCWNVVYAKGELSGKPWSKEFKLVAVSLEISDELIKLVMNES